MLVLRQGSFYPFQEIPSLSHDFSIDHSGFGIQGSYPIYPLEILENVEHSPIISIGDHIPGISDFESITGGVEILNLDPINVEQQNDQIVEDENDSIAVEALEKTNKKKQSTKIPETLTEEPNNKQN
ncbi:hypothetical protein HUJ04_003270 [Dendroctonus ponderosae]|nr:hypothetical protein HUJ04_003270 [Dendroctonus ponderosae]